MYEDRVTISVDGVIHESNKSREFESNPILSQCQDSQHLSRKAIISHSQDSQRLSRKAIISHSQGRSWLWDIIAFVFYLCDFILSESSYCST